MRVASDIDEVVVDFVDPFLKFYNDLKGTDFKIEDFYSYDFWKVLGTTKEETIRLCDVFYDSQGFAELPLVEGSYEGIRKLYEEHELWLPTARPLHIKQKTQNYFRRNFDGLNLDIHHTSDFFKGNGGITKHGFCLVNEISVILEDNVGYAAKCAEAGIKVVLFDKPWNQDCEHDNIVRVLGWKEALEVVENAN